MRVIIDTNFLLIPAQFRVNIFEEIERIKTEPVDLVVLDTSLDELRKIIREQRGKDKEAAKLALQLIEGRARILESEGNVDDAIVELADKDTIVCTQDRELKKRVQEKGAKVYNLRQKKYLALW